MLRKGKITISTTINRELWDKAHGKVQWSEALLIGVTHLLNRGGDETYLNPLQQDRKIEKLALLLDEYSRELDTLRRENDKLRGFKNDKNTI